MKYEIEYPENYVKPKMPAKAWVEALRSGEYQQVKGCLCDGNAYCCLGVLSKIQGRLTDEGRDGEKGTQYILEPDNPLIQYIGSAGEFPLGVEVILSHKERIKGLAGLNDGGFTFSEIATIIEQIWEVTE